jgi:uncharacterized protein
VVPDTDDAETDGPGSDGGSAPTLGHIGLGIDPKLLEILVCPLTKQPLRLDAEAGELVSEAAKLAFPIRQGVPIMLVDEARRTDTAFADPVAEGAQALSGGSAGDSA